MGLISISRSFPNRGHQLAGLTLLAAMLAGLPGCASKQQAYHPPQPRQDVAELRQIVAEAQKAVRATLQSVDHGVDQTPCPPLVFKTLTQDVQRLEVDSFKMRARAQAMRARGDAYFEQWHAHLASLTDPHVRALAVERHDRLQESFGRIRLSAQQTREAFQPFISAVRRLRNGLEKDPGFAGTDSARTLLQTTREQGHQVEQGLAAVFEELKVVSEILKPVKLAAK